MDLDFFFKNYSPIKLAFNPDAINRIQKNNPITFNYDNLAYNKMKGKIAELFNVIHTKSDFIKQIPEKIMKTFFLCFVIIYLLSTKYNILYYENEYTKEKKPRFGRIIIICLIVSFMSIFFLK
jgi:hypothetical protein